jgi:hypothetical protein
MVQIMEVNCMYAWSLFQEYMLGMYDSCAEAKVYQQ